MGVSVIGAGNVGQALAGAFSRQNIPVFIGVPDPEKYQQAGVLLPNIEIGTIPEAIAKNEQVIFALPYEAALELARGIPDWQNRIIVDATNPLLQDMGGLSVGTTTSGAEEIARLANNARVVKAFNSTGAEALANSHFARGAPVMPVAGDDESARQAIAELGRQIGLDVMDSGPLKAARYIEPLAMLWIHQAISQKDGRNFAFARLHREAADHERDTSGDHANDEKEAWQG